MRFRTIENKNLLFSLALSILVAGSVFCGPLAQAGSADEASDARTKAIFASESKDSSPVALTLDDIRDAGILLRFIRQDVFAIYQEASRPVIPTDGTFELPDLTTIPVRRTGKLLPPRPQWLVFFLGTMEPVVRELKKRSGIRR